MPYESEKLLAKYANTTVEHLNKLPEEVLPKQGKEREQIVKVRVNQTFFRTSILAAYNYTCCITGINIPELLIAGHIKPWGIDEKNRLNPRNGIAINALHDKAFESGYITITPDYTIQVSTSILKSKNPQIIEYFTKYDNKQIILPSRFLPEIEFLKFHNNERFRA